jgi:Sulfotransferase family
MEIFLPNFLIIGAAKAGTTSLYDWMRQHPDVFMPAHKEPKFFAWDGTGPRRQAQITHRADYDALFAGAGGATAIGEASTAYLAHPRAPARVAETIPGARLIVSLRDPVERAFSVYQMNLRLFGANAGKSFADALRVDDALREEYHPALMRREHFAADRLKVILLEDLARGAKATLAGLFGFLGIDEGFAPDVSKLANPGGLPRSRRLHSLLSTPAWAPRRAGCCRLGGSTGCGPSAAGTWKSRRWSPRLAPRQSRSSATTSSGPRT